MGIRHWIASGVPAALAAVIAGASLPAAGAPDASASRARQLERVQLHRNGLRGLPYLSRWAPDGRAEPARFAFRAVRTFALPGNPTDNVRANVHPIDVDGDGRFEFVQVNGHRFARAFRADGKLLWRAFNPAGRVHRTNAHRDTAAVLDVNGDGRQELVHCWVYPGTRAKRLVVRRGDTGAPLRDIVLRGDPASSECQIAAFRVEGRAAPIILVSRQIRLRGSSCPRLFTDLWPITAAFDTGLRRLWQRSTCDAGHYAWPVDEDDDGRAEAVFVGKYQLRPDGSLRCRLPGWTGDHVDGMTIADFDAGYPGHEMIAVGTSGARTFRAASCRQIAAFPRGTIRNPQSTTAAVLSPRAAGPTAFVRVKTEPRVPMTTFEVDMRGRILRRHADGNQRLQVRLMNGNLDGARAAEDLVTWYGQVIDRAGRLRLDSSWYWNIQPLTRAESRLPPADRWAQAPLVVDLDGDGRDEIVTWGRRRFVIGARAGS